ncbi:MAG: hypothetical protein ACREF3_12165 [Acetobacteraceae bacterium]
MGPDPAPVEPDAAAIEAFLRANPGWLAERPGLYRVLAPPVRVHGDVLADHMAAMVRAERAHAAAMAERADDVLAAGRAAAGLTARIQQAVLALIHARDPMDCVTGEFPPILAVDAACLCMEEHFPDARLLPSGTVGGLLNGRDVVFRDDPDDAALLHAEAARLARHDALLRVPWSGPPTLLALVSREKLMPDSSQGIGPLTFLGQAVGAALGR